MNKHKQKYHPSFGMFTETDIVVLTELPPVGSKWCVAPFDKVTRELWGTQGTVTQHRDGKMFLRFDQPTKSVGALMTGIWLPPELVC